MRLIPLGTYVCNIPGDGCNSSYLIEGDKTKLLLDFGNGAFGKLMTQTTVEEIDAIIVSHMHADHFLDLISMAYALLEKNQKSTELFSIPVYLPSGGTKILREISKALGHGTFSFPDCRNTEFVRLAKQYEDFLFAVYDVREVSDGQTYCIGEFVVTFRHVSHGDYTNAIRIQGGDSCFVYSADTRLCPEIYTAAQEADIFLCECTQGDAKGQSPIHLSAWEAADIAKKAQVGMLLLTHFNGEESVEASLKIAQTIFSNTQAAQQLIPVEIRKRGKRE